MKNLKSFQNPLPKVPMRPQPTESETVNRIAFLTSVRQNRIMYMPTNLSSTTSWYLMNDLRLWTF